ncbi:hypothetical protein CMUS01_08666 [Colletotrichum musicola]|uniref:Dimethylaniline monooxygenase 2 n=1 Tax=Colletotrichum musicola TaxID=2175873 RepID=A0A8H6NC86_9PEZI|nr:hypothetical protein CMUS01_08666 [Colletotrichum musicola]
MAKGKRVAVVGCGPLGLVSLKNCLEEGFDAHAFESSDYVGGLWYYTTEDKTSVLPSTIVNISKERGCFTDFPFPAESPSLCPAIEVQKYLESYADHFNLRPHISFNTKVTRVQRDERADKWIIKVEGSADEAFDRVIMATGLHQKPNYPKIQGIELFAGRQIHSKSFKSPKAFHGQNVLVVGIGNTGADTAVSLIGKANKIYSSHRHGTVIIPRTKNGRSIDHSVNFRFMTLQRILERRVPKLAESLYEDFVKKLQNDAFDIRPEWRLSPAPSLKTTPPIISDTIVQAYASGDVESVPGIRRVVGPKEVELDDGRIVEVDAMIYCTGYNPDFGMLDPKADPTSRPPTRWRKVKGSRGKPYLRLYKNVLSVEYPESLAFMGCVALSAGAFQIFDLASMAVVQLWKGGSPLPHRGEIEREVADHEDWIIGLAEKESVHAQMVQGHSWLEWADRTAGCGVNEYLGWGWEGWRFFLQEPELCGLLMGGLYSPHIYRFFDGKRKKWDGAREEIERVNRTPCVKRKE